MEMQFKLSQKEFQRLINFHKKMGIKNGRKKLKQLKIPTKCLTIEQILEMHKPIHLDLQGSFYTMPRYSSHQLRDILISLNKTNQLTVWLEGNYSDQKHNTRVKKMEAKKSAVQK